MHVENDGKYTMVNKIVPSHCCFPVTSIQQFVESEHWGSTHPSQLTHTDVLVECTLLENYSVFSTLPKWEKRLIFLSFSSFNPSYFCSLVLSDLSASFLFVPHLLPPSPIHPASLPLSENDCPCFSPLFTLHREWAHDTQWQQRLHCVASLILLTPFFFPAQSWWFWLSAALRRLSKQGTVLA